MKKGFTLVELMVVISIIGILTAMVLPSVNNFTMKARDARRKADLNSIQMALESYFEDNTFYPPAPCGNGYDCGAWLYSTSGPQWIPQITTYLRGGAVPQDPINNAGGPWNNGYYSYAYGCVGRYSNPASYDLNGQLENTQDPDRCAVQCYKYYFDNRQWCTACGGPYSDQLYEIGPLTR